MPKPSLMLNMIVKNEAARIERCLASVLPRVKSFSILDTGSTDDTPDLIRRIAREAGVPGRVHYGEFRDFSQARNEAFQHAQRDNGEDDLPWCQFALLMDADMEFVVDDVNELLNLDANAISYDMMQKAGTTSYANRRIVNLNWGQPPYVGLTHEYIDVPSTGMIKGSHFVDHADGSNRTNKYVRDIALLEQGLKSEPGNGRYLYYLANSYRDGGMLDKASATYQTRIAMGGWDEETHSAMMNLAFCEKDSLNFGGFIDAMLQAYHYRPQRVEPLYELAKAYRERGQHNTALLFAKEGLYKTRPDDLLFVNDYAYTHGVRYEYSITGYYDPKERARAFEITDALALDPACPPPERWSARSNLYWYLQPLSHYCASFKAVKLDFDPPKGYTAMNPSIEECNGKIKCNIRCVNYKIVDGRYMIGPLECNDAPIVTRNFLARLDVDLKVKDASEIIWHRPEAKFPLVMGLEDIRLYRAKGELCFSACIREQASNGTCQQVRGVLKSDVDEAYTHVQPGWQIMSEESAVEKNWMPMGNHDFVYRVNTVIHKALPETNPVATVFPQNVFSDNISGSSQLIPFKSGLLAVVHEAHVGADGLRTYWHRFARFEKDGELIALTAPFVFLDRQIEFCAGLAWHPDHKDLMVSFGVRDAEAWVARVSAEEVAMMFWKR